MRSSYSRLVLVAVALYFHLLFLASFSVRLQIARCSTRTTWPIPMWEQYSGLRFPASGKYHVPGALAPVHMDLEKGVGTYLEPNLWFQHSLTVPDSLAAHQFVYSD